MGSRPLNWHMIGPISIEWQCFCPIIKLCHSDRIRADMFLLKKVKIEWARVIFEEVDTGIGRPTFFKRTSFGVDFNIEI